MRSYTGATEDAASCRRARPEGTESRSEASSTLRYRALVAKTLVIAEKPSVARDLTDALKGPFQNKDAYYESDDYVITFAVGHLLELINP
jgi:hypothetical protein